MSRVRHKQNRNNPVLVKLDFERNLKDQWIAEWNAMLISKSLYNTYISHVDQFAMQNHLVSSPEQERISLCRFRTGNHRPSIVTGRYNSTPRENRLYKM